MLEGETTSGILGIHQNSPTGNGTGHIDIFAEAETSMGERDRDNRGHERPSTCDMLNDMMRGQKEFQQGLQYTLAQMESLLTQHLIGNNSNNNGNNGGNNANGRNEGNEDGPVNNRTINQHNVASKVNTRPLMPHFLPRITL